VKRPPPSKKRGAYRQERVLGIYRGGVEEPNYRNGSNGRVVIHWGFEEEWGKSQKGPRKKAFLKKTTGEGEETVPQRRKGREKEKQGKTKKGLKKRGKGV